MGGITKRTDAGRFLISETCVIGQVAVVERGDITGRAREGVGGMGPRASCPGHSAPTLRREER